MKRYTLTDMYQTRRLGPAMPHVPAWENPVTRGLIFLFTGADTSVESSQFRRKWTDAGSVKAAKTITKSGRGWAFNGTSLSASHLDFGRQASTQDLHEHAATWVFRCQLNSNANAGLASHCDSIDTSGWSIGVRSSSFGLLCSRNSSDVKILTPIPGAANGPPLNTDFNLVITYDGSQSAATGRMYINGVSVAQTLTNGSGSTSAAAAENLFLGGMNLGAEGLQGVIYLAAIFNRQFTDAEARDVSLNPWQLVQQRKQMLTFFPSVPAGASLFYGAGSTQ